MPSPMCHNMWFIDLGKPQQRLFSSLLPDCSTLSWAESNYMWHIPNKTDKTFSLLAQNLFRCANQLRLLLLHVSDFVPVCLRYCSFIFIYYWILFFTFVAWDIRCLLNIYFGGMRKYFIIKNPLSVKPCLGFNIFRNVIPRHMEFGLQKDKHVFYLSSFLSKCTGVTTEGQFVFSLGLFCGSLFCKSFTREKKLWIRFCDNLGIPLTRDYPLASTHLPAHSAVTLYYVESIK